MEINEQVPGAPAQVIQGGPGNASVTPPAPPAGAPLYKGIAGEARTPEELVAYTKTIEAKLVENDMAAKTAAAVAAQPKIENLVQPPNAPPAPKSEMEQIGDLIYTNPEKALELHEQVIMKKLDQRDTAKAAERQWWDELYQENPDLKALDSVVKLVVKDKFEEFKKLDLQAAKKAVAAETRKHVNLVKQQFGVKETEMPSGGTTTFGASGGQHAPSGGQTPAAPVSFIEQMRAMKQTKKRN